MYQLERVVCPPEEGSEVGPLAELDEPSLCKTIIKKAGGLQATGRSQRAPVQPESQPHLAT